MTDGYNLPARWVIHTVGPVWQGGGANADGLLKACYRNALALAEEADATSIAFPAISRGAFGFPMARAARLAATAADAHLSAGSNLDRLIFVCFEDNARRCFSRVLEGELMHDAP